MRDGERSKWAGEGRRRIEREQATVGKATLREIKKKIPPTQGTESCYSSGNQHRAKKIILADCLCSDEKLDHEKVLLIKASRREHSRKRFTPSSQIPSLLISISIAEQCSQTAKYCRWRFS